MPPPRTTPLSVSNSCRKRGRSWNLLQGCS